MLLAVMIHFGKVVSVSIEFELRLVGASRIDQGIGKDAVDFVDNGSRNNTVERKRLFRSDGEACWLHFERFLQYDIGHGGGRAALFVFVGNFGAFGAADGNFWRQPRSRTRK